MGVVLSKKSAESPLLQIIDEHGAAIECMSINDDQTILATGSQDNTVRLWAVESDPVQCLHVLRGHLGRITALVVTDDSVLSGSVDKTIIRWDIQSGECLFVCNGHLAQINRILCTGDFIFSGSYDRTARCWDYDTGECLRVFRGHQRGVFSLIYVPVDDEEEIGQVAGSHDQIITASGDGTARAWSFDSATTLRVFTGHAAPVTCLTSDTDGKILFTGSMDQTVRSWVLNSGRPLMVFSGHEGPILSLTVVNKLLYSASSDGTTRSWVRDVAEPLHVYKGHTRSIAKVIAHRGLIYTAGADGLIIAYEPRKADIKQKYSGHEYGVTCIVGVKDKLFSSSDDGTIRVWRVGAPALQPSTIGGRGKGPDILRNASSAPGSARASFNTTQRRPSSIH